MGPVVFSPCAARRSPDAGSDTEAAFATYGHGVKSRKLVFVCPDFTIEPRSQADRLPVLPAKMRE
jgi:hypothetical protein